MSCQYDILLVRHASDGVTLAIKADQAEHGPFGYPQTKTAANGNRDRLILLISGGRSTAYALGFGLPEHYPGFTGLTQRGTEDLGIRFSNNGTHYRIILPPSESLQSNRAAAILDQLRMRLKNYPRVTLIIEHDRISVDLPPMQADDTLACYWEARDLIDEADTPFFTQLRERVQHDEPTFTGIHMYTRQAELPESIKQRTTQLCKAVGMQGNQALLHI